MTPAGLPGGRRAGLRAAIAAFPTLAVCLRRALGIARGSRS